MSVADDEAHTGQPALLQRTQERGPERLGLGVTDVDAEHLTAALGGDAGRDDDRP